MTTALQLALISGLLLSTGLVIGIAAFVPGPPDLRDVVRRYSTTNAQRRAATATTATNRTEKLGAWTLTRLPSNWWGNTPTKDLALLQIPIHRHYGKKVSGALVGLLLAPLLGYTLIVVGLPIPVALPPAASLALAILLFRAPDNDVRQAATKAREEFDRTLITYTDLVALERAAGSGAGQALEYAAQLGDSWVFHRIREELARARWSGESPWTALKDLAEQLDLNSLRELANNVSLAKEGTQIYDILRKRSESLRDAMLAAELGNAIKLTNRMSYPAALPLGIFAALLVAPIILRFMAG